MSRSARRSPLKTALKSLLVLLIVILLAAGGLLIWLSAAEYRPADIEELTVSGTGEKTLAEGDRLSVLSFNIGYAALDREQDFFMDGGKGVTIGSADDIRENVDGIIGIIDSAGADATLLQEVDRDSKRSWHIDEAAEILAAAGGASAFATNFKAPFIPYPVPDMIGPVYGGLLSLTAFDVGQAARISLPTPFSWPLRTCQLKRCLLVERIPLSGSEKELVLINLHLEAYDDGAGKAAQTAILTALLEEEYGKGNYVIAGGDFNQYFPGTAGAYPIVDVSYYMPGQLETDILPEGWTFACDPSVPTCRLLNMPYDPNNPGTQYYVIDGFILSPNVTLDKVETLDCGFAFSDHNPVLISVKLGN